METPESDLTALLARVRAQDEAAAGALVERLSPLVFRIVRSHLPRRVAAEDLAQEVFLKVFSRLEQYQARPAVPFEHWVSRLAVRTCLDALRAERRRPEWRWSDLSEEQAAWVRFLWSDRAAEPDTGAASARELVERLLQQLPANDRLVLVLLDLEGRPVRDIAQLTGWSRARVKVRAFRARRKLRKLVETLRRQQPHEDL